MKLLPYILTKQEKKDFTFWKFDVFLSYGGKSIWETDTPNSLTSTEIQDEYCIPNELYPQSIHIDTKKHLAYIQIEKQKTKLSDFYTWDEVCLKIEKPECWRTFYFLQDKIDSFWWSPKGLVEAEIQGGGNIQDLFEECIRWSKDISL